MPPTFAAELTHNTISYHLHVSSQRNTQRGRFEHLEDVPLGLWVMRDRTVDCKGVESHPKYLRTLAVQKQLQPNIVLKNKNVINFESDVINFRRSGWCFILPLVYFLCVSVFLHRLLTLPLPNPCNAK